MKIKSFPFQRVSLVSQICLHTDGKIPTLLKSIVLFKKKGIKDFLPSVLQPELTDWT
jgi:hypothetical protein